MRLTALHRKPLLAGAVVLAALTGVTAASALTNPPAAPSGERPFAPQPASVRIDQRADDPSGLGPQWAVRVYEGRTGLSCLAVGRTDGRRFGPLDDAGQIQDTPVAESGSCADLGADVVQFGLTRLMHGDGSSARSVFFGRASEQVRSIVADGPSGQRDLQLGAARTFLVVLAGLAARDSLTLTATLADGRSMSFRLT